MRKSQDELRVSFELALSGVRAMAATALQEDRKLPEA